MSSRCVLRVIVTLALMLLVAMPSFGLEAAPASVAAQGVQPAAREGLAQEPTGVGRVAFVHAAPFAETITDTVVMFEFDGTPLPGQMAYGDAGGYIGFPAGTYTITVVPTAVFTEPITATVVISPDQDYTLALASGPNEEPPALMLVEDNWTVPGPGLAQLRVAHLAPFTTDLMGTEVDVRTDEGVLVDALENVVYGTFSDYLTVPAGIQNLMITAPGGALTLLDLDPIVLKDGDVMTVFAIGGANEWPLEPLVTLQHPQDPARLSVAHLAPFAEVPGDTSVSVFVDATEVLTDVTYSMISSYLELPAGVHNIAIAPTGEVTPVITGTVILAPGIDYTAAAIGDVTNQPLDLLVTMDDNTMPPMGMARLNVVHAAPFMSAPEDTAVDVRTTEGEVFQGIEGLMYGEESGSLLVDPGSYELTVTAPGGDPILLEIPTIELAAGDVGTLYIVGDDTNQSLEALLIAGEERTPTDIRFAHLAPFTDVVAASAVTVSVNGQDIVSGLTFSETTDYAGLPAGIYGVSVTPMGMTDPVLGGMMFITWDERYTAAVIGDGANMPLDLFVLRDDGDLEVPMDMALLRIVHVAPFTSTLAATAVNVVAQNGEPFTDVTNLMYKDVTAFGAVAPGAYDIAVTSPEDDSTLLDIDPFTLEAGEIVTIYIVGDGVNQPLGALVLPAQPQEMFQLFMPLILKNSTLP